MRYSTDSRISMDSIKSTRIGQSDGQRGLEQVALLLVLGIFLFPPLLYAQVMGEEAELARLRAKAEEAIANDDPDSAAMNMGRAALMAAQLAKKQDGFRREIYKGTESLFRAQEHTYRAMALFRRAGNQLPASSGVCGSLALAQGSLGHAVSSVAELPAPAPALRLIEDATQLKESTENWQTVIESMSNEYQCR